MYRGFRDCHTHFAAAVVGDIAHAVDFFFGAAGGDKHSYAFKILIRRENVLDGFHDCFGFSHFTFADVAARKSSGDRLDNLIALLFKPRDIFRRIFVFVHIRIHRGTDDFGRFARHNRRREHIVRNAVCDFPDGVCGCGRNDENVGAFRKSDVFHLEIEITVEQIGDNAIARQRFKRQRLYEFGRVRRHDNDDGRAFLFERTDYFARLIRRDTARHSQNYGLTL